MTFWRSEPVECVQVAFASAVVLAARVTGKLARFANTAMYLGLSYAGISLLLSMVHRSYQFIEARETETAQRALASRDL